ncbi:uncharacterized protein LOC141632343 [Silene latifolia]|uniref:uncharacterized protein LOC141632343 n=1 Tax=Silene latifolia TaxID=37657 RepID=UPI003D76AAED
MSDCKKISTSGQTHPEESKAMATPIEKVLTTKEATPDEHLILGLTGLKSIWHRNAKKGYLKDLIQQLRGKDEGSGKRDPGNNRDPPPPPPIYEVKFINGGSEICDLTSSAAKKVARESKLQSLFRSKSLPAVTFDDSDLQGVPDLHHDSLVITMQIGTAKVSRILIDGGSSINLVMLDVLKAMKIDEEKITKKSNVLVGFSGETKSSLGEINLPTYAEGVAFYGRCRDLDCLSSYNVIMGRPWIHNVKAIPSTYHQRVKIPTEWGITTIRGEQKAAQECYTQALKPSKC